ncbi:hypothetical protein D3C81_931640 [compost metagenome]
MRLSLSTAPATAPATDTAPVAVPAGLANSGGRPSLPAPPAIVATSVRAHWTDRLAHLLLALAAVALLCFVLAPIAMILAKSVQNRDGSLAGIAHFRAYFESPALLRSVRNSLWVSALATCITVPLAFAFAYALTRSRIACKGLLRNLALIPLPGGCHGHAGGGHLRAGVPALLPAATRARPQDPGMAPGPGERLKSSQYAISFPIRSAHHDPRQRPDPSDPRPPHHLARDQAGHAARLGIVGRQLQQHHAQPVR